MKYILFINLLILLTSIKGYANDSLKIRNISYDNYFPIKIPVKNNLASFEKQKISSEFFNQSAIQFRKKKFKKEDIIGFQIGLNYLVYNECCTSSRPYFSKKKKAKPVIGFFYKHQFRPRWSHNFQFRLINNEIDLDATRINQDSNLVEFVSEVNFKLVSFTYQIGFKPFKELNWGLYIGQTLAQVLNNHRLTYFDFSNEFNFLSLKTDYSIEVTNKIFLVPSIEYHYRYDNTSPYKQSLLSTITFGYKI